ncbi:hypothetical protein Hdeb2414_s0055g00756291 [Helianthus debilis subsp. tardiflorus]
MNDTPTFVSLEPMMMKSTVVSVSDEDNDDDNLLMTALGSGQFLSRSGLGSDSTGSSVASKVLVQIRFRSGICLVRVILSTVRVRSVQVLVRSTQVPSESTLVKCSQLTKHVDAEYCRLHASESRLGNDITKSY